MYYLPSVVTNPADTASRAALALDKNTSTLDMTDGVSTGSTNYTNLNTFVNSLTSGNVVRFNSGTMRLDFGANASNYVQFKAGVRYIGHEQGTIFKVTNPGSGHTPLRIDSNTTFENITFLWDPTSQPTGGSSIMVWGLSKDNVVFKRCTFIGPASAGSQLYFLNGTMPVSFWGCTNVTMEQCEVKWATGTQYGLNVIGGSDHFYDRCYFHDNAADGVKIQGNVTYGRPKHIRFSDCRSDANGQTVIQGQTIGTSTITTTTTISPVNGGRYRCNFGSTGNLTLNNGTNGDVILLSKVVGSQDVTVKNQGGSTLFTMTAALNDRKIERLTFTGGAWWTSDHDYYTNGEGWDIAGENIVLDNCVASANDGAGFQVKPTQDDVSYNGSNACCDIRFVGCTARASVNGNGFGVVNAITSNLESCPQNITFSDCSAIKNLQNGFIFSTGLIFNVSMVNCRSRANGSHGGQIQAACRNIKMHMCDFSGNGAITASSWNLQVYASKGLRLSHCTFQGCDPTDQGLLTEVNIDNASNAKCYGVYLDKVSEGYTMSDCFIENCRFEKHLSGLDVAFYTGGTGGAIGLSAFDATVTSSRVALGANSAGVLYFTNQQSATGLTGETNYATLT